MCGCAVSLRHGAFSDSAEIRKIRMGRHLPPYAMVGRMPRFPALAVKYALPR